MLTSMLISMIKLVYYVLVHVNIHKYPHCIFSDICSDFAMWLIEERLPIFTFGVSFILRSQLYCNVNDPPISLSRLWLAPNGGVLIFTVS